jgi:hypothetical protein
MKPTRKLIIFIFTFLALAASAYAQSPREELQQMVEQLRKAPNDPALRKQIIKLAQVIKPAPAIPEEAREPFVMGAAVLKRANDPAGAGKAVDLFTQALTVAPWFADAYYNRAIAREAAGQFEPAMDDLKLYLEFNLSDAERREAQDKIYALKADAQLASARKAEQDKIASAERDKARAQQAKRDVITQIKNLVGNASTVHAISYLKNSWTGGVNQRELFGDEMYYIFSMGSPRSWKFFDERVELWSRFDNGIERKEYVGESHGDKITDMHWIWAGANEHRIWGYLDPNNGNLFLADVTAERPLNDAEFDPNRRYIYWLFKPMK